MIDRAKRQQAIDEVSRLGVSGATLDASYNGRAITPALRDELLAKLAANQHVEIELELLAFEQKPGQRNRKNVRIRDGAMMAAGRSGKGKPFLRDHARGSLLARGGTILESATEKRGEGDYAVRQRARLSAPWAVDAALRGLLDGISVAINPTGPIECSACGTEVFDGCWHCPGEELEANGTRGATVVEWIYTSAEFDETSAVNVPAVASAHIESIRAALSAQQPDNHPTRTMTNPKLLAILTLAATAGENEVLSAVERVVGERDTALAKLEIAESDRTRLNALVATHKETERKTDEDKLIRLGIDEGRISLADESMFRKLHSLNAGEAKAEMAKRAPGSATPVGQSRQSAADPNPAKGSQAIGDLATQVKAGLAAHGVDVDEAVRYATMFGAKKPLETLAGELGVKKGA